VVFTGERFATRDVCGVPYLTSPIHYFVLFHVVFTGERFATRDVCGVPYLTCKVPYKMMEVVPQISNTWIVFTLPFSLSHSIITNYIT